MLFTKECDYAIRIMRALSSGDFVNVSTICASENLSSAMAYKNRHIEYNQTLEEIRKLEKAGLLKSLRGANGGYALNQPLQNISLYDVFSVIEPDILLLECMKKDYHCSMNTQATPCLVHGEFCRIQRILLQELQHKNLAELFRK